VNGIRLYHEIYGRTAGPTLRSPKTSPMVEPGRRGSLVRIQSPRPLFEFRGKTGVTPPAASVFSPALDPYFTAGGGSNPAPPRPLSDL